MEAETAGGKLHQLTRLIAAMGEAQELAVAVSGGVDSLTLAAIAHAAPGVRTTLYHARSPAVPEEATARVLDLGRARGWQVEILDAGEFARAEYRANPLDRCFHCKTSLYGAIRARTAAQLLSGTNVDDLGEFRPGLIAARDHAVRHPFVEVGVSKAEVRALARAMQLGSVSELPAAPCLSSRIETGIAIDARMLALVHASEKLVGRALNARTVRCRVRASGVVLELDAQTLDALNAERGAALAAEVGGLFAAAGMRRSVGFAAYRNGSAFVARA